jgi:hypothetical protein
MTDDCNLAVGSVSVTGAELKYNGPDSDVFSVSFFRILGTSGASRIFVQRSEVSIILSNILLTGPNPFAIWDSSVTVLSEGGKG